MSLLTKSDKCTFAFTYKRNVKKGHIMEKKEYDPCLDKLREHGEIESYVYEDSGTYGLLHIHGLVYLPRNIRYTTLKVPGYTQHFDVCHDKKGWLRYMKKDLKLRENFIFELKTMTLEEEQESEDSFVSVEDDPAIKMKMPKRNIMRR